MFPFHDETRAQKSVWQNKTKNYPILYIREDQKNQNNVMMFQGKDCPYFNPTLWILIKHFMIHEFLLMLNFKKLIHFLLNCVITTGNSVQLRAE